MIKFYTHTIIYYFHIEQHNHEPVLNQIDQLTTLIHKKRSIHNKSLI